MMRLLDDEAAQGRRRRLNRNILEVLGNTQFENERLLREQRELQKQNDRAIELVRTLVDRSEAFRRLATHLRDAWQPSNPSELPLKASLKPLLDQKKQELANDPNWARERDADIAQRLCAPTAAAGRKR